MVDTTIVLTFGDEEYSLAKLTVQEMLKVRAWTTFKTRPEWHAAILDEDPAALLAAYVICQQRNGATVSYEVADFAYEDLDARFVETGSGRTVEPMFETKADGSLLLDKAGDPVAVRGIDNRAQWKFTDTGEPVPPTPPAPTT